MNHGAFKPYIILYVLYLPYSVYEIDLMFSKGQPSLLGCWLVFFFICYSYVLKPIANTSYLSVNVTVIFPDCCFM